MKPNEDGKEMITIEQLNTMSEYSDRQAIKKALLSIPVSRLMRLIP